MEWININSIDDLKKMGKLKPVMKMIKDDLAKLYAGKRSKDKNIVEMINVRSNSWQGLYDKIIALREVINSVESNYINSNNKTEFQVTARKSTSYFNSLEAEYIFYLLELDGKQRADKLHITMKCYSDKAFAKSSELNGCKSSICSPTPIYLTGIPSPSLIASTTPPFAVPSSFVRTIPVIPVACLNCSA